MRVWGKLITTLAVATLGWSCGDGSHGGETCSPSFETCRAATNQSDCTCSGGDWTRNSTFSEICACPTGEGGIPCTSHSQCLGGCVANLGSGPGDCIGASFFCAAQVPLVGCFCVPGEDFAICD